MFNLFKCKPSQIITAADAIFDRGIDVLVKERNAHLLEMDRLADIVKDAQAALDQHTRLYEALNNTLFAINHPFGAPPATIAPDDAAFIEAVEMDFDLSVDHPTDDERKAAELLSSPPMPFVSPAAELTAPAWPEPMSFQDSRVFANLEAAERGDFDPTPKQSDVPVYGKARRATAAEAAH